MAKFRKKPVVIEAVQLRWTTWCEVCEFLGDIISPANPAREIPAEQASDTCGEVGSFFIALTIPTLEGDHTALHGDWIIRGVKGEFYPCKPDIFAATYESVEDAEKAVDGKRLLARQREIDGALAEAKEAQS
jgi:thiol-disulfide isomerase/thioredoxin